MSVKTRAAIKLAKHFGIAIIISAIVVAMIKLVPSNILFPAFGISLFVYFVYCMFNVYVSMEEMAENRKK